MTDLVSELRVRFEALYLADTWDAVVPGLGVRTSASGRRTFVLMARYPGSSNPTRRALGVYGELSLEQAREKAREWLEQIRRNIDPAIARKRQGWLSCGK